MSAFPVTPALGAHDTIGLSALDADGILPAV